MRDDTVELAVRGVVNHITGGGEMLGTGKKTRFVIVEGKDDQILFNSLVAEPQGNDKIWCSYTAGKDFVIEAVTELHSLGYHCGIGIVDPDYDEIEYPVGVIPLDKNNLEALLLSSDSFDSVIDSLPLDFNQQHRNEMMEFIQSNGKDMAIIRIFNHNLDEVESFSCDELSNAIVSKGFNSKKFAELCLKKPHPRGKRHLEAIRDGNYKVDKPHDFDSNYWRWINGKDGIKLTIQFIENVSNIPVDCKEMKIELRESYLPIHFRTEIDMIRKIVSHQNTHSVELFRPEAIDIE